MKLIHFLFLCLFSVSSFAATIYASCPKAVPTNNPGFCGSFKSVATCHCTSSGLPSGMCQDMNVIYKRMISIFGSVQKACEYQKDTSVQDCMNDWLCYRTGGTDSTGNLCSGTGKAC